MEAYPLPVSSLHFRSNIRHLFADVAWYGVLAGSSIAFLSVFAARLGAGGFELAWLAAGPGLANLAFSLPFGRWLERRRLDRVTWLASIWHRAAFLMIIPLPWILSQADQVHALLALVFLMSIPGTLLAIGFNALFADLVPAEWRGQVVGRRNALLSVATAATSLVCGAVLDHVAFPGNYQVVFAFGFAGAALSSYHLSRLRQDAAQTSSMAEPRRGRLVAGNSAREPQATPSSLAMPRIPTRRSWIRLDLLRGPFGPLLAAFLLFYTSQYLPIPLFPLFWVQDLKLTDGAISVGNALFYLTNLVSSMLLERATARLGNHRLLFLSSLAYGLYPILQSFSRDAGLFWIASIVGGFVWALVSGTLFNRLMERVPPDDRPAHMALHNIVLNGGILLGSMAGPALAGAAGIRRSIFIAGMLRVANGAILGFWG